MTYSGDDESLSARELAENLRIKARKVRRIARRRYGKLWDRGLTRWRFTREQVAYIKGRVEAPN